MAAYVKLLRSIWQDADFVMLPGAAQRTYMMLMSQKDISHCGVLPLTPGRWGHLAADTDADSVRRDIHTLQQPARTIAPFVLVDLGTEELLIRSYVKHDEGYRVPNGRIALARAIERVMSVPLRQAVLSLVESLAITLPLTLEPPQQPAASSQLPRPAASSHEPSPNGRSNPGRAPAELPPAAAAALEALIEHKAVADSPRVPDRYKAKLRKALPTEHAQALLARIRREPHVTPLVLATDVLHMRELDAATILNGLGAQWNA